MIKVRRIICLIICIIAIIASVFMRLSIKNTYNMESTREELLVPYFTESIVNMLSPLEKKLSKSSIIIVGKATGKFEYVYRNLWQEVNVTTVIKGKDMVSEGTTIKVVGSGQIVSTYDKNYYVKEKAGRTYVDTSFLDYMRKDDEYLIFIDRKVNIASDEVYSLNQKAVTMQYLNLTRDESQICSENENDYTVCEVQYKKVQGSEFVTNSETALKKFYKIKHRLIKRLL